MKTKKEKKLKNLEKLKEMKKEELISICGGNKLVFIDGKWVYVDD